MERKKTVLLISHFFIMTFLSCLMFFDISVFANDLQNTISIFTENDNNLKLSETSLNYLDIYNQLDKKADLTIQQTKEEIVVELESEIKSEPNYLNNNINDYKSMECTAYCMGTTRCDGEPIREGVCATSLDYYGKIAYIYEDNNGEPGELLGCYECLDTGADWSGVGTGDVIDIYIPNKDACIEWGRKKVLVLFI